MFRNVLRTSRCLAVRRINIATPIFKRSILQSSVKPFCVCTNRDFSSNISNADSSNQVEQAVFEDICNETLESLCEYFEEIIDRTNNLKGADVTFSDGVLTVNLGTSHGTYVINRQTPNKQIWLSSPVSGPKRYDLVLNNGGYWIYKHDGVPLHRLLQEEISKIIDNVDFNSCNHSLV
ncbi:frataxin homolog, mitochondrial [Zerene cesonia]|uniref:frataxin homolog, mitochondrial n=1 Tax=Zerene cesonia TaxID=33412 RepID=UPI0018E4F6BB|nr:frataxin homolog, mitochondrial [Zerene cesonia]